MTPSPPQMCIRDRLEALQANSQEMVREASREAAQIKEDAQQTAAQFLEAKKMFEAEIGGIEAALSALLKQAGQIRAQLQIEPEMKPESEPAEGAVISA